MDPIYHMDDVDVEENFTEKLVSVGVDIGSSPNLEHQVAPMILDLNPHENPICFMRTYQIKDLEESLRATFAIVGVINYKAKFMELAESISIFTWF